MTDTTASSDAKQSQPAASLSGSELDRLLGKLLGRHHRFMVVDRDHCTACHDFRPTYAEVAAERQQDRQRIADLEDVLWAFGTNRDGLWDYRRDTDLEHPTIKAMVRLLKDYHPEAQPSSGGDES